MGLLGPNLNPCKSRKICIQHIIYKIYIKLGLFWGLETNNYIKQLYNRFYIYIHGPQFLRHGNWTSPELMATQLKKVKAEFRVGSVGSKFTSYFSLGGRCLLLPWHHAHHLDIFFFSFPCQLPQKALSIWALGFQPNNLGPAQILSLSYWRSLRLLASRCLEALALIFCFYLIEEMLLFLSSWLWLW